MLQCIVVHFSAQQCVAVCCSMLQCVAVHAGTRDSLTSETRC